MNRILASAFLAATLGVPFAASAHGGISVGIVVGAPVYERHHVYHERHPVYHYAPRAPVVIYRHSAPVRDPYYQGHRHHYHDRYCGHRGYWRDTGYRHHRW